MCINIVYLQCDCRFNKWLLEKIAGRYVIEHTIEKCSHIVSSQIIAGIFECPENRELAEMLSSYGITVYLLSEDNVTKRFLDVVERIQAKYVIRVGGDQVLLDYEGTSNILCKMENEDKDWFYEEMSASLLPDIVRRDCLIKNRDFLEGANRYFDRMGQLTSIKRHKMEFPLWFPFHFRADSIVNFHVCESVIQNHLDVYDISERLLKKFCARESCLAHSGLLGSWVIPHESAGFYYDEDGNVNPFLGKTIIDFIKCHLNKNFYVFEWGSGNSTLFWAKHVNSVVSVEHDKGWYQKMKERVPDNMELRWIPLEYGGEYCKQILKSDEIFDIIMIDGRDRVRCAQNSVNKLAPNGVIVWDDTHRDYYGRGYTFLKENGFKRLELQGIKYGSPGVEGVTSIFYRAENIFGL